MDRDSDQRIDVVNDKVERLKKEVSTMQMHEAPGSFNVKFVVQGYECQFTVRGELPHEVLERGLKVIQHLGVMKAEPRLVMAPKNGGNGQEPKVFLCPQCKVEGAFVSGVSQKNGRAYSAQKCPQCGEFVKDTFRWGS